MRILLLCLACLNLGLYANEMVLHRGLMTAEGAINFPIEYTHNYHTSINMSITPRVGYFAMENFWIGVGTDIKFKIFDSGPVQAQKEGLFWSVGTGVQYYFSTRTSFFPYVGFFFSVGLNDAVLASLRWSAEIPLGVLWAFNEYVGLSLGIPVKINFTAQSIFSSIKITPGVIGITAFF